MDRGIKIVDETGFEGPIDHWTDARQALKDTVIEQGYIETADSFVRSFETETELDAAVLQIPSVGFLPPDDPRVQGMIDTILDRLTTDDGLVNRYEGDDGLPGEEDAFVVCSFWLINDLVLSERIDEATTLFQDVCEYVNPLGLLAEEVDSDTGAQLGNFHRRSVISDSSPVRSLLGVKETRRTYLSPIARHEWRDSCNEGGELAARYLGCLYGSFRYSGLR